MSAVSNRVMPASNAALIAPLAAAAAAWLLGLDGDAFGVVVVQSAMPAAVFTSVVATQEDLEPERVVAALVLGTLIAIPTLLLTVALVT